MATRTELALFDSVIFCVKYIVKNHSKVIVTTRNRWRAVTGIVPLQLLEVLPRLDRASLETPWEND